MNYDRIFVLLKEAIQITDNISNIVPSIPKASLMLTFIVSVLINQEPHVNSIDSMKYTDDIIDARIFFGAILCNWFSNITFQSSNPTLITNNPIDVITAFLTKNIKKAIIDIEIKPFTTLSSIILFVILYVKPTITAAINEIIPKIVDTLPTFNPKFFKINGPY